MYHWILFKRSFFWWICKLVEDFAISNDDVLVSLCFVNANAYFFASCIVREKGDMPQYLLSDKICIMFHVGRLTLQWSGWDKRFVPHPIFSYISSLQIHPLHRSDILGEEKWTRAVSRQWSMYWEMSLVTDNGIMPDQIPSLTSFAGARFNQLNLERFRWSSQIL